MTFCEMLFKLICFDFLGLGSMTFCEMSLNLKSLEG